MNVPLEEVKKAQKSTEQAIKNFQSNPTRSLEKLNHANNVLTKQIVKANQEALFTRG